MRRRTLPGRRVSAGLDLLVPQRANLTLIGVPVPAGAVDFELIYDPRSVRVGLWISLTTLAILLVLGIISLARTRRSP